jgi:hydroxyacylglutathione hydrolase
MLSLVKIALTQENCYIADAGELSCLIVDPGGDAERILRELKGRAPVGIVLTHGHFDHTAGLTELLFGLSSQGCRPPVAIHSRDAGYLGPEGKERNLAIFDSIGARGSFSRYWKAVPSADLLLDEGKDVLGTEWRLIHTPGHSPGSVCLYHEGTGILLSGDTLFAGGGVGRTDLPDSVESSLSESIQRKLFTLPDDTVVYPGHGPSTTIGAEKSLR